MSEKISLLLSVAKTLTEILCMAFINSKRLTRYPARKKCKLEASI